MPESEASPTLAEAHVRLTKFHLLASGDDLAGRRIRAQFVRSIEPSSAALQRALGCTYDVARAIHAGRALRPDEAEALARLLHEKWARQTAARAALEAAAAVNVPDEAETPPAEVSAVS